MQWLDVQRAINNITHRNELSQVSDFFYPQWLKDQNKFIHINTSQNNKNNMNSVDNHHVLLYPPLVFYYDCQHHVLLYPSLVFYYDCQHHVLLYPPLVFYYLSAGGETTESGKQ
jgi:hypothetical protein